MTGDASERASTFLDAAGRNQARAHGPCTPDEALVTVLDRLSDLAEGRAIAVPAVDEVLDGLGLFDALRDAGLPLVAPDDDSWRDAVAACGVGVTGCVAAVAETGTVALSCGPGAPRAVSLLPDAHLCVVPEGTIEDTFETALETALSGGLPPNLVWVSGPSRSADIEKRITLGVHGPRTVEVVVTTVADGLPA